MTFSMANRQIIEEFRTSDGHVGGVFQGDRLLLLATTGGWTGAWHTVPLSYVPDGRRFLVIAVAGGSPAEPDWYLVADPQVTLETGIRACRATAIVLQGEDRERAFARAVKTDPRWATRQAEACRILPVIALEPIDH
ncbi:nitroreductase/quinone reductase family protein [Nonomuraea sp. B5E05]|uniref:nitroreductase/quinone reductase family protein n=1 Tax=Nonomuraea sp. B5E05 TaxID=3153569 RepID=UPI0032611ADF